MYLSTTDVMKEQLPAIKIEDGQIQYLKPSQLPLMAQVNINEIIIKINIFCIG